ncbi:unnamed protein product [Cylicostephanus goldi]|uniref:Uncharacterized protein n=1 Tax=Cylicostephanus goldi TaxID=71465 RepID=A0A3P6SIS7_CYLGO|nr:unnamed protein product [Cylicostephanus goldi]
MKLSATVGMEPRRRNLKSTTPFTLTIAIKTFDSNTGTLNIRHALQGRSGKDLYGDAMAVSCALVLFSTITERLDNDLLNFELPKLSTFARAVDIPAFAAQEADSKDETSLTLDTEPKDAGDSITPLPSRIHRYSQGSTNHHGPGKSNIVRNSRGGGSWRVMYLCVFYSVLLSFVVIRSLRSLVSSSVPHEFFPLILTESFRLLSTEYVLV